MNSDTGQIYYTEADIRAAQQRGEPLEPIGPRVAEMDKAGRRYLPAPPRSYDDGLNRRERRKQARQGVRRRAVSRRDAACYQRETL